MVTTTYSTITTVLEIKDFGDGKYEVNEIPSDTAVIPNLHSGNRKQLDFDLPVPGLKIVGYYDEDDLEIGAYATLGGTQLGPKYSAGINTGLNWSINIGVASGGVGIFKSGNKIKGKYHFKIGVGFFSTDKSDEFDIISI